MIYFVSDVLAYYPSGGFEDVVLVTRDERAVADVVQTYEKRHGWLQVIRLDEDTLLYEEADLTTGEWHAS